MPRYALPEPGVWGLLPQSPARSISPNLSEVCLSSLLSGLWESLLSSVEMPSYSCKLIGCCLHSAWQQGCVWLSCFQQEHWRGDSGFAGLGSLFPVPLFMLLTSDEHTYPFFLCHNEGLGMTYLRSFYSQHPSELQTVFAATCLTIPASSVQAHAAAWSLPCTVCCRC